MKLPIGETCILSSDAILWKRYPTGASAEDGMSYSLFAAGTNFTIVGEHDWLGQSFTYLLDEKGETYVSKSEYLSIRVRLIR